MQLKGTMIVPVILVETAEEQNNKGEVTCEKELTAATETADHSHRGRNLGYLSCSALAVTAHLLISGPIFNQISSFVPVLWCAGECTLYKMGFFLVSVGVCTNTHVHERRRVTENINVRVVDGRVRG